MASTMEYGTGSVKFLFFWLLRSGFNINTVGHEFQGLGAAVAGRRFGTG